MVFRSATTHHRPLWKPIFSRWFQFIAVERVRNSLSSGGSIDFDFAGYGTFRHLWVSGPVPIGNPKRFGCCLVLCAIRFRVSRGDPLRFCPNYFLYYGQCQHVYPSRARNVLQSTLGMADARGEIMSTRASSILHLLSLLPHPKKQTDIHGYLLVCQQQVTHHLLRVSRSPATW